MTEMEKNQAHYIQPFFFSLFLMINMNTSLEVCCERLSHILTYFQSKFREMLFSSFFLFVPKLEHIRSRFNVFDSVSLNNFWLMKNNLDKVSVLFINFKC